MTELLVTIIVLLFPFVIPVYTVWQHPNWKGMLLGALTLWIFMAMGEAFLIGRYGSGGPAGILLALWVVLGLPISAVFCGVVLMIRKSTKKSASIEEKAPEPPKIPAA